MSLASNSFQLSEHVIGDQGEWARYPSFLWPALADPRNEASLPLPRGEGDLQGRIDYWMPLMALTMGALGWIRPDLGIERWMHEGGPQDTPALQLLHRWWGPRAGGLVAWGRVETSHLPTICASVDRALGHDRETGIGPERSPLPAVAMDASRMLGTNDGLHLHHIEWHLTEVSKASAALVRGSSAGDRHAVLVLDRYAGWYRQLSEHGATLPARPDGRSWQVEVVVRSIGSLGVYRRSRETGRWFTGRHRWHVLGSPFHG